MKINEINVFLEAQTIDNLPQALKEFEADERSGVQKLLQKYERKLKAHEAEKEEWQLRRDFDAIFHDHQKVLVGIDEVGRGPLAGPVVAAAVILPDEEIELLGVKDSKKLTEAKREKLYDEIQQKALAIGVGMVGPDEIDEINILQATFKAMREALHKLGQKVDVILVDGDKKIPQVDGLQEAIIKGDNKSASIAAASIIAKVTRDRLMEAEAAHYPEYDWVHNKGYGSSKHYEAIHEYGITPLHRKSFLKNEGIF